MATIAPRTRLNSERKFFLGIALALAICTFAGFARTYYLMEYTGAADLPWLVHLHGMAFTSWILLFGLQAGLISGRRHDVHIVSYADAEAEPRFNDWFDREHVASVLARPGFERATSYELYRVLMNEPKEASRYLTVYEFRARSPEEAVRQWRRRADR